MKTKCFFWCEATLSTAAFLAIFANCINGYAQEGISRIDYLKFLEGDWEPCEAVQKHLGNVDDRTFYSFRSEPMVKMRFVRVEAKLKQLNVTVGGYGWVSVTRVTFLDGQETSRKKSKLPMAILGLPSGAVLMIYDREPEKEPVWSEETLSLVAGASREGDLLCVSRTPLVSATAFQRAMVRQPGAKEKKSDK